MSLINTFLILLFKIFSWYSLSRLLVNLLNCVLGLDVFVDRAGGQTFGQGRNEQPRRQHHRTHPMNSSRLTNEKQKSKIIF